MKKRKIVNFIIPAFLFVALGFAGGWTFSRIFAKSQNTSHLSTLRLSGYKWISPLLACDLVTNQKSVGINSLTQKINDQISNETRASHIDVASVYYRDLKTGDDLEVNSAEKYYPASLNKIPIMIAYFKAAETKPELLKQKIIVDPGMTDMNSGQEILPKDFVKAGGTYTILEMIEKMIVYSDNNSFYLLDNHLESGVLESTYKDLDIQFPADTNSTPDFVTAKDFSYFFRVLRNSTYLAPDLSEKALDILSRSDFKDGIVSGLPSDINVAHKFGLRSDFKNGDPAAGMEKRELHDCGYVYSKNNPYLICVMTKSSQSLADAETAIKNISEAVYSEVEK